ncbi:hypothetical protein [Roseateles sp.]|uniref:hypothetical protein n=1 Tax=Roseateles sp. TaxID=1971397 RepID=UPI003D0F7128
MQPLKNERCSDADHFLPAGFVGSLRRRMIWLMCLLGGSLELLALQRARRQR